MAKARTIIAAVLDECAEPQTAATGWSRESPL
jgi:hypothetical protein